MIASKVIPFKILLQHYFNNTYDGQTPEIFKLCLLRYLMVSNLVDSMEDFLKLISDTDLSGKQFTLIIDGVDHYFIYIPGGVTSTLYTLEPYFLNETEWKRIDEYNY